MPARSIPEKGWGGGQTGRALGVGVGGGGWGAVKEPLLLCYPVNRLTPTGTHSLSSLRGARSAGHPRN